MNNFINTILETSKDRLKNPLIGTFIFSWIAINWKPISVLFFSSDTIYFRIDIIEQCYSSVWFNLVIPLAIALFYIIALPYIMWGLDFITNEANLRRKENLKNLHLFELNGKIEIARKENEIEDLKAQNQEKVDLNRKIRNLNSSVTEKNEVIEELEMKIKGLENTIESTQSNKEEGIDAVTPPISKQDNELQRLLDRIFENDLEHTFIDLAVKIYKGDSINNQEKYADYFIELGLIRVKRKALGVIFYDLTEDGEKVFRRLRFKEK